jgi:hypothetical protein
MKQWQRQRQPITTQFWKAPAAIGFLLAGHMLIFKQLSWPTNLRQNHANQHDNTNVILMQHRTTAWHFQVHTTFDQHTIIIIIHTANKQINQHISHGFSGHGV